MNMSIRENIQQVRENIAAAALSAGRHVLKGCNFCTRCRYVKPECFERAPTLREVAPGHKVACHIVQN